MPNLYWDDVTLTQDLPSLVKEATTRQLVQYAGASLDFYEIHYDKDFALGNGLPDVVIHGAMKSAWLAQMVVEWAGPASRITAMNVRYREMDVPGDPLECHGRVTRKFHENARALVECEVWLTNGRGERTTDGTITAELPSR